jgi:hypothetical protein
MNQLVEGRIPAHTPCPFRSECTEAANGHCAHMGTEHTVPFSCGYARLFNIMGRANEPTN